MREKKKPKATFKPSGAKEPRTPGGFSSSGKGEPREEHFISAQGQSPSWHFQIIDFGGPWCPSVMDGDMLRHVKKQLAQLETMLWREIEGPNHHAIKLNEIIPKARNRLEELGIGDIEEVFSLRVGGKPRIIGIRHHTVLRLLWWDPGHEVCPWKGPDN